MSHHTQSNPPHTLDVRIMNVCSVVEILNFKFCIVKETASQEEVDQEIEELTRETQHDEDEDHVHTKLLDGDSENLPSEFKPSPVVRRNILEFGSQSVRNVD